jgi:carboxypeptidase Q
MHIPPAIPLKNLHKSSLTALVLMGCIGPRPASPVMSSAPPAALASKPAASAVAVPTAAALRPPPAPAPLPAVAPPSATALAYSETARRIREASLASDGAFQKLSVLTDTIGPRLSGSPSLERAVSWAKQTFSQDGHEHVTLEPVRVPHWVRGAQSAEILAPFVRPLQVLTLGGSVATPPAGITAEVLVVSTFEELEARRAEVSGKIVLFDHALAKTGNPGLNYGEAIPYRTTSAARAARFGAAAVLVRSLTAHSLGAPHTGSMRYLDAKDRKIPAAAISVEDAELLHRLASRGAKLKVHLALSPQTLPDADSNNVTAEIVGRELAQEVVLIGAHLDSWDVGQGAQDDGAGVVTMMQALTTLRRLGLTPRRTVRVVLFVNEENGVRGAAQYEKDHRSERHVAAFEMDSGAGAPLGFMTDGDQPFLREAREIAALLAPIGANTVNPGFAGEDVGALKPDGVPLFGVLLDIEHYFDVHHSAADTLDKIDPVNLQKAVAALATMAFVIADRGPSWNGPESATLPPAKP